jgi:hypothetical protein
VPVTRVDGGPPDFDEQCEMCQAMDSAKAHEKRARELRRRAAAILKTRRAMRTKRGSRS